jgi:hypothetical protein
MPEKVTQCKRVLDYIEEFGSITTLEAFRDLGIARLASRIHDLKMSGYVFKRDFVSSKNRYGETVRYMRYSLDNGDE